MGRKKKSSKSNDGRGYSQGGPQRQQSSSSSSAAAHKKSKAPSVSTRTHGDMKDLLDQFGNSASSNIAESSAASSSASPSDRFTSRLSNIVDHLDELGFISDQVESVVTSLQYEITIEGALD